jgi:hypothetical protein
MRLLSASGYFLAFTFFLVLADSSHGQISFNFHLGGSNSVEAGLALEGLSSGTYETGGVTLSAAAYLNGVASAGSEFNGAGNGWGINAAGGGDNTQAFDKAKGLEAMVFTLIPQEHLIS